MIGLSIGVAIVIVNALLDIILRKIVEYELHPTITEHNIALSRKLGIVILTLVVVGLIILF